MPASDSPAQSTEYKLPDTAGDSRTNEDAEHITATTSDAEVIPPPSYRGALSSAATTGADLAHVRGAESRVEFAIGRGAAMALRPDGYRYNASTATNSVGVR